ncbi:hypothetical protein C731_2574 [Mycolicibacterium hassiacum DSM 44199]|uniref:Uncharacterized protein n=1 Tax=Mycolicibacterium hassiacum (strain DSM 44199 / CIP 105218 / JCM 12690 / 3849) TaxID=1122247 RepID=K5BB59_MYCHD|nr:hypothetical protein C731_2574 [Mycolicibacterium hassiacum DSM 44199]
MRKQVTVHGAGDFGYPRFIDRPMSCFRPLRMIHCADVVF